MIDWTGQRVLITGAASGIGRALAVALAARGAQVAAADINADGVIETAALCGGEALVLDLADGAAGVQAVERLVARHGRLDAVFANAGIGYTRRLLKADLDDPGLARLWEINMLGPTRLAQALVAAAETGGWGTVSNFVRGAIGWNRKDHRYGDREGRFGPAVGWS